MLRILAVVLLLTGMAYAETQHQGVFGPWASLLDRAKTGHEGRVWRSILDELRGKILSEKLDIVNKRVNEFPFVAAPSYPGIIDRWKTPDEFFAQGGACRDYAVTKFFLLRASGVPDDQMRVEVLYRNNHKDFHAVLNVILNNKWIMLDNFYMTPKARAVFHNYKSVYAFNEENWWSYERRSSSAPSGMRGRGQSALIPQRACAGDVVAADPMRQE